MTNSNHFGTKNSFVEEQIREAIVRGEVIPGEWLRPDEWARRLGVSQTPIREALRKLEAQGLVTVYPHRGAQVSGLDLAEFVEVYQIRAVLEGLATRLAVSGSSDTEQADLIAVLDTNQERMITASAAQNGVALRQANQAFHMAIYAAAKSPRLEQLIINLWTTFPWDTLGLVPGRPERAEREHIAILEAVRARDADRASALITQHVETAAKALLLYVESSGVSLWQPTRARRVLSQLGSS